MNNKQKLLLVFVLFLLTKVFFLDNFLWYDEAGWGADLFDFTGLSHTPTNIPHMPLAMIFFKLSTLIFGYSNFALRLVPLIFGIGIFFLVYSLGKRIYNKETGLLGCLLLAISFWPTVAFTTIDMDGAVLSFFILLSIYFFVRKQFILAGICLSLCTITRIISGGMILFIIFVYYLVLVYLERARLKDYFKEFMLVVGGFIVTVIPLLFILYFFNPSFYGSFYLKPIELITGIFSSSGSTWGTLALALLSLSVLLWATPLLIFPLLFRRFEKKDLLFYLLIIIPFVVFVFSGKGGDPSRYTSIVIPYLAIICGNWIYSVRKDIISSLFWIVSVATLLGFFVYNYLVPFAPPLNYIDFLHSLGERFFSVLFIFGGSTANPFYISFFLIFTVFLVSFLLFLFKTISFKHVVTLFLAIALAFNVFLVVEYNFALTQPDIKGIGKEMIEKIGFYLEEQPEIAVDYANYEALEYYFGYAESDFFIITPFNLFFRSYDAEEASEEIEQGITGRYVFFIDYLKTPRNAVWSLFEQCSLIEHAEDKGETLGYFYSC